MQVKNKNKVDKIKLTNPVLLKGASLEEQNIYIQKVLHMNGINGKIQFEPTVLQKYIDREKTFGKGLISYLKDLEQQLDELTINQDIKLYIFQILSELGSLVFPNTSSCYSIIPNDLKKIKWEEIMHDFNENFKKAHKSNISQIQPLLNVLLDEKHPRTFSCIVSLCLCNVLIRALNKDMNGLLVDENGKFAPKEMDQRPRIKSGDWLGQLVYAIKTHLNAINSVKNNKLLNSNNYLLDKYSKVLAMLITTELLNRDLMVSFQKIESNKSEKIVNKKKTLKYFVWCGSNLLVFPKTLSLPMVYKPENWIINNNKGADNGGYVLSSLTNISYQGYLNSKSYQIHDHKLRLNKINHLNSLQNVKFTINSQMINFYKKHKIELTKNEIILISDIWVNPTDTTVLEINKKWSEQFVSPDQVREAINTELEAKKSETLRNQEILKIAELYCNKDFYWPAVQDFRGRIYRIGHLNIQLNTFVRSLITFSSDKPFVNRKKNKNTLATFNLLLKEVLVKKDLIEKWDTVFGNRFINNNKFEELLLEDLLAKKLSLIQVGQLLLIRQGAYDKVGVYYDASASAYQIMGLINADKKLCQLTNVLETDGNKQDIYDFFLNQVKNNIDKYTVYNKDKEITKLYNNYLSNNVDRKLVKAIVMPLIYGKTSKGFAENLKTFFKKGHLYPSDGALIKLASQIIKTLKEDSMFAKVSLFMKGLRGIGGLLFDSNNFTIRGDYSNSHIVYYKEEIEQISLYYKTKLHKYKSQKVNLSRPIQDTQGNFVKSKTKAVNAFVANYVHFLDASVCHYVIDKLNVNGIFNIGTIHDCFLIKPKNLELLTDAYKEGLIKAHQIHVYNIICWLHSIQQANTSNTLEEFKKFEGIIEELRLLTVDNNKFEAENIYNLQRICWDNMLELPIMSNIKEKNPALMEYLQMEQPDFCLKMKKLLNINSGQLLFSDN